MMPHLIWAGVVLYAIHRADVLITALLAAQQQTPDESEQIVIPDDLEAFALMESELHAQESVRDVIRDRYAELQNWNLVRRAIGVGTIDE